MDKKIMVLALGDDGFSFRYSSHLLRGRHPGKGAHPV